jgi:uncharacterized membrane protein
LAVHEASGGHTLARHVGLTEAQLDARLASNAKLDLASTFSSRAEAEAAGSFVLNQNGASISAWQQAGATGKLPVSGAYSGGTVRLLGGYSVPGTGATFVLKGNGAGGYFILTGFPTP